MKPELIFEKAILRKNGIINPVSSVKCSRRLNADYIIGIPDDEIFRQKVNLAIWSGIKTDVLAYLNENIAILEFNFQKKLLQKFYISLIKN